MALNWITPTRGKGSTGDVTIALRKGKDCYVTCFNFRNRSAEMLCKGERISFAVDGTRIYFKEDANGYKLSDSGVESKRANSSNVVLREWSRRYQGNYPLLKDKVNGLWFIEANVDSSFDKYK